MIARPRRLRDHPLLRETVADVHVRPSHLMLPLFVQPGRANTDIPSMPGVMRLGVANVASYAEGLAKRGLHRFIVFGVPGKKSPAAEGATSEHGIVPQAVRVLRDALGAECFIATDVCLCSYTDTGHCGVMDASGARVDNDATLPILAQTALRHADAGADMVAPSDMMDGRVAAIRATLDQAGFGHLPILSYAAKYASSFYGPFRDAADSAPVFGDRRGYQMDPRRKLDHFREAALDEAEGADMLMVKPALAYLDVLRDLRRHTSLPLAAYQVSGEYSMLELAAQAGVLDRPRAVLETWSAMLRAGASLILTYHAAQAATEAWL